MLESAFSFVDTVENFIVLSPLKIYRTKITPFFK